MPFTHGTVRLSATTHDSNKVTRPEGVVAMGGLIPGSAPGWGGGGGKEEGEGEGEGGQQRCQRTFRKSPLPFVVKLVSGQSSSYNLREPRRVSKIALWQFQGFA